MSCEVHTDTAEQDQLQKSEGRVVPRGGVLHSVQWALFWPFGIVVRAYHGLWSVLGFRRVQVTSVVSPAAPSPARPCVAGRKRLHRVTRLLLAVLPQWLQEALGYPVSSSIGRSLSPEIRVSPTKPCGKGSKRKQDELDEEDDDEEEHPTWVEALTQEMAEDEDPEQDPDYEPTSYETESEEYRSHNSTESDIEVTEKGIVIEDVSVDMDPSSPAPVSSPPV